MNRTAWLQDRRMEKFCDVLSRWKARELSAQEAGEILGCSERQFRRYRRRYEEEGLTGLFDKRLGKASVRRVPIDKVTWVLSEYRKERLTQVGRALLQLGIEHIPAYSPEARGRSERAFGTLQSRLPKELRLFDIDDIATANQYIREVYLPMHNKLFARPAQIPQWTPRLA